MTNKQLEKLLSENSISISIDKNVFEKGDKILHVDIGKDPVRINKKVLDGLEEIFDVKKTDLYQDSGEFLAYLYIEEGEN